MKVRIVKLKEIESCPQKRLDPKHYIPSHKTEECHENLVAKVEQFKKQKKRELVKAKEKVEKEIKNFKESLRI